MNISLSDALSRGYGRMQKALFKPFDIAKWFAVGFTAFLAGLLDKMYGGTGRANFELDNYHDFEEVVNFPSVAWDWLVHHPVYAYLILFGIVAVMGIVILLIWLSSRGKFAFLDNVVHDRANVVLPWNEYAREGNSLFLWRLVYGFIIFFVITGFLVLMYLGARTIYIHQYGKEVWIPALVGVIAVFLVVAIIVSYINLFLDSFVVPVMYKNRVAALKGWGIFLGLFNRHVLYFLLYGLFIFVLMIAVVIAVFLFGLFTCCLGFLLLIIPYISSVLLLPVSYTYKALSLEFLRQFGPEYDVFPAMAEQQ